MTVLSANLKVLLICGCWRLSERSTPGARIAYNIYSALVVLLVCTFTFAQFMDMILNVDNSNDFTDNSYTLVTILIACWKMASLLKNRKYIAGLLDVLAEEPFKPSDTEEDKILYNLEKMIRSSTLHYTFLVESTVMVFAATAYIVDYRRHVLTFRAWLPYDYTPPIVFFFTYIHQWIGWTAASLLHIAADTLICGFFIHTSNQFDVLVYRLKRVATHGNDELRKCVRHHDQIYQFASNVNEVFWTIIFIQFLVSTLVVCFNLCQMIKIKLLSAEVVQLMMYMSCMLTQIFLYCWYGNEVKLKSLRFSNEVFQMDWTGLNIEAKRMLTMIMTRAREPIEFSTAYIISMNLDSFVGVLKTSYSAYTLLQRAQ